MNGSLPAEAEALRRDLHGKGYSDKDIAETLGMNVKTIHTWRRRRNLKPNKPKKIAKPPKPSELLKCPEANRRFICAFERDLVRVAQKSRAKNPDISAFMATWRDVRAKEVMRELEEVLE